MTDDILAANYATAVRAVRRLMPQRLNSVYDPEDFVQEAMLECGPEHYHCLARRAKFRMIEVARLKYRNNHVQMDDRVAMRLESFTLPAERVAEINEETGRSLDRVRDPEIRLLVEMKLAGHSVHDIAKASGLNVRTVQRRLESIK